MSTEHSSMIASVLRKFDSTFSKFSSGFNDGNYVFWLGSGISRERVPNVNELLERVLEHLRLRIDVDNPDCEYRVALEEILRFASLTLEEHASIDVSIPVDAWALRQRILLALETNYAGVLDVEVGDEKPPDYLVWTGLDAPSTYGRPDIEPDVEHYCIAILMLEGLVPTAVTANWDGLLEKALTGLTADFSSRVRVVVKPEDFRGRRPGIEIIKFHGCAVRARQSPEEYRKLLVARKSQISTWSTRPENRLMRKQLEALFTSQATLMLGLSAQDANLHTVFGEANQDLARSWPASPPPVVLSEENLGEHHKLLLQITFGDSYPDNKREIANSVLLGAYAKPVLLALVLWSLAEKLSNLVARYVEDVWGAAALRQLQGYLLALRDVAASLAQPVGFESLEYFEIFEYQREFTKRLIDVVNLTLTVFRTGTFPEAGSGKYVPLSEDPIARAVLNRDYPSEQFGGLGVALALVGRGLRTKHWTVLAGDSERPGDGVIRLRTGHMDSRVFFVKDARALIELEIDSALESSDESSLVVVSDEEPRTQTRSPRSKYGRIGKTGIGRFNVASSMSETTSTDDLFEAFKLAGGF